MIRKAAKKEVGERDAIKQLQVSNQDRCQDNGA